jgi:small GTP-binding protein
MTTHKFDYLFKILIIGEVSVGKTCLLLRYADDSFTQNHLTTLGIDFKTKIITINNSLIKLQIWDTAGQEKFRTITKSYYKDANGIILTYDISNSDSLKNIQNWMKLIEQNAEDGVCKILVGNKCDLENRAIKTEEGEKIAQDFGMKFFETSAKSDINVDEAFNYLVTIILEKAQKNISNSNIVLEKDKHKKKKKKKKFKC